MKRSYGAAFKLKAVGCAELELMKSGNELQWTNAS